MHVVHQFGLTFSKSYDTMQIFAGKRAVETAVIVSEILFSCNS